MILGTKRQFLRTLWFLGETENDPAFPSHFLLHKKNYLPYEDMKIFNIVVYGSLDGSRFS